MTTETTSKATVVESGSFRGTYDLPGRDAIVDDVRHGRLYITEEYGGEMSPAGGAYRWRHGTVLRVAPGTTLEQARQINIEDPAVPLSALLEWDGHMVACYAESLGL